MFTTSLEELLRQSMGTDKVNDLLKKTRVSSPKLPLSGVMDDLSLSDLENVKPNELNMARDIAKKQMALQDLDSAIKPKISSSRGVTAADWAMDPEIGRDFERILQEHFNAENLKKNMNNPKATQALTDAYHDIKKDQRSKFVLGEGSEPTKPLTRDEINRLRIRNALNKNPGEFSYKQTPRDRLFENLQKSSMASESSNFSTFDDAINNAKKMADLDEFFKDSSKIDKFKQLLEKFRSAPGQAISKAGDKFDDIVSQLSKSELLKKYGPMGSKALGAAGAAVEGHAAGGDFSDVIDGEQSLQEKIGKGLQGTGKSVKGAASLMGAASLPAVVPTGGMAAMPAMLTALAGQTLDTAGQVIESPTGYTPKQVKDITKGATGFLADQNKLNPNAKTMGEFMKQPIGKPEMYDYVQHLPTDTNKIQNSLTNIGVANDKNVQIPDTEEVKQYTKEAAKKRGVPEHIALASFDQESSFNPLSKNPKSGASGLNQMFPLAYQDVVENNPEYYSGLSHKQMLSPENWKKQIDSGLDYYNILAKRFKTNDPRKIIYRYYGPKTEEEKKDAETHVEQVMEKSKKYLPSENLASRGPASISEPEQDDLTKGLTWEEMPSDTIPTEQQVQKDSLLPPEEITDPSKAEAARRLNTFLNNPNPVGNDLKGQGPLKFGPVTDAKQYEQGINSQERLMELKDLKNQNKLIPQSQNPVEENIEQQTEQSEVKEPSRIESLLNQYRELASEQSTGLKAAQEQANKDRMLAGVLKGVNIFGSGATGVGSGGVVGPAKVNNEVLDSIEKYADTPIDQYAQQVEDQKNDPSSKYSQMMREYLLPRLEMSMGRKLEPQELENLTNTPGSISEKMLKFVAEENEQKEKARQTQLLQEIKSSEKQQQNKEKAEAANEKVERGIAARSLVQAGKQIQNSGGPSGTQLRNRLYQAGNIFTTLGIDPDASTEQIQNTPISQLDKAKKLQIMESAVELNKLLTGSGTPAARTLEKLILQSGRSKAADIIDWLTNEQSERDQGEYLKDIIKIASNARDNAKKELTTLNQKLLPSLALAKKHYPKEYSDFIKTNNLMDVDEYLESKTNKEQQTSSKNTYSNEQLKEWANQNGKTPEEAAQILQKAGFKPE